MISLKGTLPATDLLALVLVRLRLTFHACGCVGTSIVVVFPVVTQTQSVEFSVDLTRRC